MGILVSLAHAAARCLWVTEEHVYVGSAWTDDREQGNQLTILDRAGHVVRAWRLPFLVADVAIVADRCVAALGPGDLAVWDARGLAGPPAISHVDANAPKLAVHGDTLMWGTSWGEIHHVAEGRVAELSKAVTSIAIDADRIYAGFADGKLRVFSRAGKRLASLPIGKRAVCCDVAGDTLVTIDAQSGATTVWDAATLEVRATFTRDPHGAPYGVTGARLFGARIVSRTHADVEIHDREGNLLRSWRAPVDAVADVWLDGDRMLVAAGGDVHAIT